MRRRVGASRRTRRRAVPPSLSAHDEESLQPLGSYEARASMTLTAARMDAEGRHREDENEGREQLRQEHGEVRVMRTTVPVSQKHVIINLHFGDTGTSVTFQDDDALSSPGCSIGTGQSIPTAASAGSTCHCKMATFADLGERVPRADVRQGVSGSWPGKSRPSRGGRVTCQH